MHHAAVTAPRLRPVVHAQPVQLPLQPARLNTPPRFGIGTGAGADSGELIATTSSSIIVRPRRIATSSGSSGSGGDQLGAATGASALGGLGLGGGPVPVPLPFSAIAPQLLRGAGAVGTSASLHFPTLVAHQPLGSIGLGLVADSGSGPMLVDDPSPSLREGGSGSGGGGGPQLSLEHVMGAGVGGHEHEMSSPTATLGLACETEIVSSQDEPLTQHHLHSMATAAVGSGSGAGGSMTTSGTSGANNHLVGRAAAEQQTGYHTPARASHRGAH